MVTLSPDPCTSDPSDEAASRLGEIDREIVALRREQRLFRRSGFADSLKVMQIVALQMEQRECLAELKARGRTVARLRRAPAQVSTLNEWLACAARAASSVCAIAIPIGRGLARQVQLSFAPRRRAAGLAVRARSGRIRALSAETRIGA